MKNDKIRVFSYGSNMLFQRLANRITGIQKIGTGWVNGYQFTFNKISKDGSAKANLIKGDEENKVFGVVYEFDISQKEKLDKFEGKGYGYEDTKLLVHYSEDSKEEVWCYLVLDEKFTKEDFLPYHWYKEFVLRGAKENKLPALYTNEIEELSSQEDSNQERREKNWKVINS